MEGVEGGIKELARNRQQTNKKRQYKVMNLLSFPLPISTEASSFPTFRSILFVLYLIAKKHTLSSTKPLHPNQRPPRGDRPVSVECLQGSCEL